MGIRCKMAVEEGPVDWEDSQAKKSLSDFVDEPRHAGLFGYTTSLCDLSTEVFVLGVYLPGEAHGGLRERQLGGCPGEQR